MRALRTKTRSIMLIVAIVFVLSTLGIYMMRGSGGGNGGESPRDKAVASIDGKKVMQSDIERGVRNMAQQNSYTKLNEENIVKMRKSVLDNMAVYEELKKETASRGIKVEKSEIDEAVKRIEEQFPTKEAFQQYMDNNRIRMKDLREEIELRLAQQKLLEQVTQDVVVSEEEAKEFYDQTSEFFFTQPAGYEVTYALFDSAEVAEFAKERLQGGENWDEVMESIEEEGVLDWVALEDPAFVSEQEFEVGELRQFTDLEMNEIGGPAEFGEGNVLIFAKRKKLESRTVPFEEISGDIVKILKSEKIQQNEQEFFKELRERADVKIHDEGYFPVLENTLSGDEGAALPEERADEAVSEKDVEEDGKVE
ncbi:MAG: SurA N-terminal domain-containing protein [Thermovirgaceae bacterium]